MSRAFDALGSGARRTAGRYRQLGTVIEPPSVKTVYEVAKHNGTTFAKLVRDEADRRPTAMRSSPKLTD